MSSSVKPQRGDGSPGVFFRFLLRLFRRVREKTNEDHAAYCDRAFFFVSVSAGWVLRLTAQQQTRKINVAPAPALRVEELKESEITGKTVYQPQMTV